MDGMNYELWVDECLDGMSKFVHEVVFSVNRIGFAENVFFGATMEVMVKGKEENISGRGKGCW